MTPKTWGLVRLDLIDAQRAIHEAVADHVVWNEEAVASAIDRAVKALQHAQDLRMRDEG